jgi:hypothetical protein
MQEEKEDTRSDRQKVESEASGVNLLGMALEKIEQDMLHKMGGAIGKYKARAKLLSMLNGMMAVSVTLVFDMDKLKKYLAS